MGEPATENTTSVSESLEEIDEQMEELKTSSEQEDNKASEPARDSDTDEQELNLNTEEPPDFENIEKLVASNQDVDETDLPETPEPVGEPGDEGQDNSVEVPEESHIDITDDELWEEDDIEEIPLFEEEFLEQELEGEKKPDETVDGDVAESSPKEEAEGETTDSKIEKSNDKTQLTDGTDEQPETVAAPEKTTQEEQEIEGLKGESTEEKQEPGRFATIIPWVVTAVSGIFCLMAIVTLWLIASGPEAQTEPPAKQAVKQITKKKSRKSVSSLAHAPVRGTVQAIDLAPFLIPAQKSGELVFFKLKVELIVPNATTKQELLKREAWVRDIIYQELKGINISRGIKGDILARYRRPIIDRLNKEMAPLRIEDVRLMGFLLR